SRARTLGGVARVSRAVICAAAAQVIAVVVVAAAAGNDGVPSIVVAAVAGPVAVLAAARIGERIAGNLFGAACAWVFVLAPFVATLFFLSTSRHTWLHALVPDLVGVRSTGWYSIGAAVGVVVALVPARLTAALGAAAAVAALIAWGLHPLAGVRAGVHES